MAADRVIPTEEYILIDNKVFVKHLHGGMDILHPQDLLPILNGYEYKLAEMRRELAKLKTPKSITNKLK